MNIQSRIMRTLEWAASKRGRGDRTTMVIAVLLFVVGLAFALRARPDVPPSIDWALLLLVPLVGVPLTVWTSALEYQISVDIAGHKAPMREAMRVSLLASAANLLPVPGSVIVRTGAMRRLGASTGKALIASAVVGIGWVGISAALTGALLLSSDRGIALIALIAGCALLIATWVMVRSNLPERSLNTMVRIVVVEAASVAVKAFRLYVILHAFGHEVDIGQAMALALAAVIVTAIGFFPAGLGATELLTAALSPLVGLPAAVGLLAAAVDRILGLVMLALMTLPFLRRSPETATPDG